MRPVRARPRSASELAGLPDQPEVVVAAAKRGVESIVHFTTTSGAVGILATGAVKSRKGLPNDRYLEHVYRPNAALRKDIAWLDYVNLSISRINDWMFETSARWHAAEDNPWVAFAFSREVLGHPGVVFATTNNIYPSCERAEGLEGFERLFSEPVAGRYSELHRRQGKQSNWPTDRQAEVLYPGEVSCAMLQRIDVQREETIEIVMGALAGLGLGHDIPVRHAPEVFE